MSSKEHILSAIRKIEIEEFQLPSKISPQTSENLINKFSEVLIRVGGKIHITDNLSHGLQKALEITGKNCISFNAFHFPIVEKLRPHEWESLDFAILPGQFGVAENGSIWLSEKAIPDRIIPFICKHLIVILHSNQLVQTMHEAYLKIQDEEYGYGVFISGPSKTADIEQSLVMGAHGSLEMSVIMVGQ
jgi:L-lactate dehydrogenase complex protein LldG